MCPSTPVSCYLDFPVVADCTWSYGLIAPFSSELLLSKYLHRSRKRDYESLLLRSAFLGDITPPPTHTHMALDHKGLGTP